MTDSLRALLQLTRPVRSLVVTALALEAAAAAALLAPVFAAARLAAAFIGPEGARSADAAWPWLMAAACGAVIHIGAHAASSWLLHAADNRLQLSLRRRALAVFADRPVTWIDREGTTAVKRAVGEDVDALHHVIGHGLPDAVASVVAIATGMALMAIVSPPLAIAAVVPVLAAVLLQRRQRRHLPEQMRRYLEAGAELDRAAVELVRTAPVLKIFGAGAERFTAAARGWAAFVRGWARTVTPTMTAQQVLLSGTAALFVVAVALASGIADGPGGLAAAIGVALIAPFVASPLWSLAFATQGIAAGGAAAERVDELLTAPDERTASGSAVRPWPGRAPAVQVEGLTLTIEGHRILGGVGLDCPPGGVTVIVGGSGAGKSTLLECLAGLIRPDSGAITVGGTPLDAIGRTERAEHVATVWQTPLLVRGTVLDNLRLGRPGLDPDRCTAALDAVGLGERILTLPRGEATVLGDDIALSGGERQRLCLARALAADPDLLLLDEPASWVDRTNASLIDQVVASLRTECTVVRADHRLEVALEADHVVVLDAGRVVESGPPDRLRETGGAFADLLASGTERTEVAA